MQLTDEDYNVVAMVKRELRAYNRCLEQLKLRDGLKHILSISRLGNGHVQAEKPWKLIKGSPEEMYAKVVFLKSYTVQWNLVNTNTVKAKYLFIS